MAGSSQSTTTTRAQSTSDTYIPEYSQTPILNETAMHARAMSDQVYAWGMDVYNKNQGNIDGVMRDALSYASPQRIAVDMGMAEAGVQQAAERGRLSAVRDLESYGIDPSSGRYQQLDSANRVMSAAAAAGAGNQQRMADQAAGNAMRQQAISASLQNAQFGSQVGRDANAFLQTAMSLKYPPLGRTSQSTSSTDSQSSSVQTDPPQSGGSKGGGEKQPSQGGGSQPKGGGQPQGQGPGREPPMQRPAAAPKPEPTIVPPPIKPAGPKPGPGEGPEGPKEPTQPYPEEYPPSTTYPDEYPPSTAYPDEYPPAPGTQPTDEPTMPDYDRPTDEPTMPDYDRPTDEPTMPDIEGPQTNTPVPDEYQPPAPDLVPSDQEPLEDPMTGTTLVENEAYDPYADNAQQTAFGDTQYDPVTGLPIEAGDEGVTEFDTAGSLYGLDEAGGWTADEGVVPASYSQDDMTDMWSDVGQGTYDSSYDEYTADLPSYYDDYVNADVPAADDDYYSDNPWESDADYNYNDEYEDTYADWGEEDYYADSDQDYGDYEDDYADWSEEDYYDDFEDQYGEDDSYDDYTDDSYEDYADDSYDFGEEDSYEDYADDSYEDYADESYDDGGGYEEYDNYDSGGDYTEYDNYDAGGGESYDEGARGGAVMRGPRRGGKRRARIMPPGMLRRRRRPPTGYGPRPLRRPPPRPRPNGHMPAFAQGGPIDPPPQRPPGAAMRLPKPQQAPRPQRGAPMAAPGGPRPAPMGRGPRPMPGNMISANGMPPPTQGGMPPPQRMARGGSAGQPQPTTGGFVSREMSPSNGSKVDDVQARLNAGEFVIPKDVATWKGKEFFYKMIAQARKNRSAPNGGSEKPTTGFSNGGMR